jgi:hypothetical protein
MAMPQVLAEIAERPNPQRRDRSCPRAVKRARHNSYPVKKPGQAASTRHQGTATIRFWPVTPPPPAHSRADTPAPAPTGHHKEVPKGQKRVPGSHARPPVKRHQPGPVPASPPHRTRRRDRDAEAPQTRTSTP